jgi:uncharacterized protein
METTKSFRGTGWAFPPSFNLDLGAVNLVSEVEDIEQSLTILLNTRPGERVMRPDFGCALDDLIFEPLDAGIITYMKDLITKSILYYESRVNLLNINIASDPALVWEGRVLIEIELELRSTNGRFNYVYDYYKREATIQPLI